MRILLSVAFALFLATAPCVAQMAPMGGPGQDSASGTGGMGGGKRGKGGQSQAQDKKPAAPKADEKAFRSAIDSLPDRKYDPWRGAR